MAILDPIIEPPPNFATVKIAKLSHGGRVGSKTIRNDLLSPPVAFESLLQKPQCRRFVPFLRNIAFQHLAFMIDCTP